MNAVTLASGISLYPQGTLYRLLVLVDNIRYIPVPTGNAMRENKGLKIICGISLYPQGTPTVKIEDINKKRYIPVPTGNATVTTQIIAAVAVYPCTHRER